MIMARTYRVRGRPTCLSLRWHTMRILTAILAIAAALGAFTGCASRPSDGQSGISVYGVVDEGVSLTRDR